MSEFDLSKVEWNEIYLPSLNINRHHIYFLYDSNDEIIYIGQARNVISRFGAHLAEKSEAGICKARYFSIEGDQSLANIIEAELILKFNPPFNITIPANDKYMSLEAFRTRNPILKGKGPKIKKAFARIRCSSVNKGYYHIKDLNKMLKIFMEGEIS